MDKHFECKIFCLTRVKIELSKFSKEMGSRLYTRTQITSALMTTKTTSTKPKSSFLAAIPTHLQPNVNQ